MLLSGSQADYMSVAPLIDLSDAACQAKILQLFAALGDAVIVVCKEVSRRRALCHAVSVVPRREGGALDPGRGKALRLLGPSVKVHVTDTFVEVFQMFLQTTVQFMVDCASSLLFARPRLAARRGEFNPQGGPVIDALAVVIRKLMLASPTRTTLAQLADGASQGTGRKRPLRTYSHATHPPPCPHAPPHRFIVFGPPPVAPSLFLCCPSLPPNGAPAAPLVLLHSD